MFLYELDVSDAKLHLGWVIVLYQIGIILVYQIAPTRLEHALVDDFPQTSRKLPKGFPEGVPRASQGFSKVLMGLETS